MVSPSFQQRIYSILTWVRNLSPITLFMRMSLGSKMLIGYAILIIASIIIIIYAKTNFQQFSRLNKSIITIDMTIQKVTNRMHEALMDQDDYEKRYLILRSNDIEELFWKRGNEFKTWLTKLNDLRNQPDLTLEETKELEGLNTINTLYKEYEDLFAREVRLVKKRDIKKAYAISNLESKKIVRKIELYLDKMSSDAKNYEELKMKLASVIGPNILKNIIMVWLISVIFGVLVGVLITYHITSSIHKLVDVTEHIASGDFDYDANIRTSDEIGELSKAFISMGKKLKELKNVSLDASPLTHLPGGIAVENVLNKYINSGEKFAFFLLDIDNFKSFNDRYGYERGNLILKKTAQIIETVVKEKGGSNDFVGHIGGDDFVIISKPEKIHELSNEIIDQFDKNVVNFYDLEDKEAGYITSKNRQGVETRFPIMTLSIAIVTNEKRRISDTMQVSEIAAELKDYAKTIQKSIYVIDKRIKG